MKITLRNATSADTELLEYWDTQPHVIDSDPNDDWNWEEELRHEPPWREQLVAELDGRPVGFIQIIDPELEESRYWGEMPSGYRAIDIWIGEAGDLGKGYGSAMMKLALERCFKNRDVHTVLIDPLESNTDAIRFYERLGFEFVEVRWFGEDKCHVYEMTFGKWQKVK